MYLLQFPRQRMRRLQLLTLLALLFAFNVCHFAMQYYDVRQQAHVLFQSAQGLEPDNTAGPRWLTAHFGLTSEPQAAADYLSLQIQDTFIFVDRALLVTSGFWVYLISNLMFLSVLMPVWWLWQRQLKTFANEELTVSRLLEQLEIKLELRSGNSLLPHQRLHKVAQNLNQLLRRDQEVRHLVRVQGLVDHELAIGNRVFFESKLQHYLSDTSEVAFGALFIIQLTPPEPIIAGSRPFLRLRACVDILQGVIAGYSDTVLARLADNDLALLVAGLASKDMEKLGDRIAVLLSRASCFSEGPEQDVVHIGYAGYRRGQTSYQVLSEADMALKTAQLHGPNAAYGFVQQDRPQAKGSVWWRSELSKALLEHRFSLSFQPVFSWQERDILQHEVLIRLQSQEAGSVPAAIFLPMAHNCGLASEIDKYVMLKTARMCAVESRTFNRCSVNISVQSLLDPLWWQWLEQMVLSGQIDPQQLAIEVAEHHLLRHYKSLKSKMLKLDKTGFALVVDQVGLVIDNTVYVDELPLESVKLHPSVVRNIDQHLEQQLFVRGLIAGFAGKGVRVIATGVELEAEWLALQKSGVAGGQGFYFSQPLNQIIAQSQLQ